MRYAGLTCHLNEEGTVFTFYKRHKLQYTAAQNETGLYLLDWEPVPPSAPRASTPRALRFPCPPAPVDKPSPSSVGGKSSPVRTSSAFLADARRYG